MAEATVISMNSQVNVCLSFSNISKLKSNDDGIYSPEIFIREVPWKVSVHKEEIKNKKYLAVFLHLAKKMIDPQPATATFELLSFDNSTNFLSSKNVKYKCDTYVFDNGFGYGTSELILWDDLFDIKKGFVKDDTIKLEIKIKTDNLCKKTKSKITFENLETSNEANRCVKTFRLFITNIENLMALQSPKFNMQGSSWDLTICKSRSSMLQVNFTPETFDENETYNINICVKLVSLTGDKKTVGQSDCFKYIIMQEILSFYVISWQQLLNPKNGFVNNNSIEMEVEIKICKSEDVICNDQNSGLSWPEFISSGIPIGKWIRSLLSVSIGTSKLKCSVCFDIIHDRNATTTKCGHPFCPNCITKFIKALENCPTCNEAVSLNDLHSAYIHSV